MADSDITETEGQSDTSASGDDWGDALAEQKNAGVSSQDEADRLPEEGASAEKAEFQSLEEDVVGPGTEDVDLDVILDVPVSVSMEIGRTKMNIRNLLQLNQGSVVELDRLAGEPMDVLVNGTLIAHGEVVVVNDKFGIRLTDVISATERVKKLK